jgi:hypothetical protein
MNPMRGVQPSGTTFGSSRGSDRVNRYVSEEEAGRSLDPMRVRSSAVVKANKPPQEGAGDDTLVLRRQL